MVKIIYSWAKINLGLWVLGKRADGYHEILTILHRIDLRDEIRIKEGALRVETSTGIPQEDNLVYRGLKLFARETGILPEVSIYINKRIPEGAGLGGGSSNLSAVLEEVNRMCGSPLSRDDLRLIAGQISSDAPFFLGPPSAVGRGRGEILEEIDIPPMEFTLIVPPVKSSTRRVYSSLGEDLPPAPDVMEILEWIRNGRLEGIRNVLGETACDLYPEIGEVIRYLKSKGVNPLVSGSGSAVFYIGKPFEELKRASSMRRWRVFYAKSRHGV